MALNAGDRKRLALQGVIVAAAVVTGALLSSANLQAQKPKKPLTKNEIVELLESGVPPARVGQLARQYGIAFELTSQTEAQLLDAGASEDLMRRLRGVAPRRGTTAAQPGTSPVLTIESTPGGVQVYVDDEPVGTTSSAGRLKLSQLAPGTHQVRLSLSGYQDYEETVDLVAGGSVIVAANLQTVSEAVNSLAQPASPASLQAEPNLPASVAAASAVNSSSVPAPVGAFTVAHDHGSGGSDYCVGVMMVGNGMVAYRSQTGVHSLQVPVAEIKEAKKNSVYLAALGGFHIRLKNKTNYNFVVFNAAGQPQSPDALLAAIASELGR